MSDPHDKNAHLTFEFNLHRLAQFTHKPEPFTPGEPMFWDDPHISGQMLSAHLDPDSDLASRKRQTIETSVGWIITTLGLKPGDSVLDLGCGPGLYAAQLAARGLSVSGVDISRRSISYARDFAAREGLAIGYRCQDYRSLGDEDQYDAALLIFGDYCTFNPGDRRRILRNIHQALRPGGHFVVDVSTRFHRARVGLENGWHTSHSGFWRPGPHLVLEQGFDYPEKSIWLDQYVIVDESGTMTVYRNWFQDYDPEAITAELSSGGFTVQSFWADLTGTPYQKESEWIGLVAKQTGE